MWLIGAIRAKMRDYPELNRLIDGVETSDRMIAMAIMETIDDFNNTPPLIESYSLSNFPSVSLLIRGSIINILESVGLLQTRNQLTYRDGDIPIGVSDKTPLLFNWITLFTNRYEQQKIRLKKALNLRGALNGTGISSEYQLVDGFWDSVTS